MPKARTERIVYTAILLTYAVLGILFAIRTPDWQAPDEPAHYNYIAQVASGDLLPEIEMGDWDNAYLETLKAENFPPHLLDRLDTVQYEDHQPPLYYWTAAPLFILTNGSLTAIRLLSVFLGAITVALTFAVVQSVFPKRPQVALGAMALVAFLPQQLHMTSTVNNDALAGVIIGAMLLASVWYLQYKPMPLSRPAFYRVGALFLSLLVGIAFITKTTTYFLAGVVLLVLFMRWWTEDNRKAGIILRQFAIFVIPLVLFAGLYWGRNLRVYGFPDFLGLARHDAVVIGQLRTADYMEQIGTGAYWQTAIKTTFHSFWGQFGWMEARMADAVPLAIVYIGLLMIAAASGLVMYFGKSNPEDSVTRPVWIILGLVLLLAILQFIYYNLTFVQFQGRYLFAGLTPFALAMALGVDVWRKLVFGNSAFFAWLTVGAFLLFAPLDLYLIWRVIPGAVG